MQESKRVIAKVNARGTVWNSYFIGYNLYAYKMEAKGSTKRNYQLIDEIVVRPRGGKRNNGWEVLQLGESVQDAATKGEAQRAAEELLDNPRDGYGWLVQNTGRIYP